MEDFMLSISRFRGVERMDRSKCANARSFGFAWSRLVEAAGRSLQSKKLPHSHRSVDESIVEGSGVTCLALARFLLRFVGYMPEQMQRTPPAQSPWERK